MDGAKDVLESQYSTSYWDYLRNIDELSRFSVVAGYCHFLKPKGSLLEIGCGEGILQERLDASKYSRYLGVDISTKAIERAHENSDGRTNFVAEDATKYAPSDRFDIIVFNEVLEYFQDPLALVGRYEDYLEDDGLFIVSMYVGVDTVRTKRIWKMLEAVYERKAETRVSNGKGQAWVVRCLIPRRKS